MATVWSEIIWTGAGFKHGHCEIRNYLYICDTVLPIIIQFDVHTVWSLKFTHFSLYTMKWLRFFNRVSSFRWFENLSVMNRRRAQNLITNNFYDDFWFHSGLHVCTLCLCNSLIEQKKMKKVLSSKIQVG